MTQTLRTIYRFWAVILFIVLIVQVFLAGLGIFDVAGDAATGAVDEESFDDSLGAHAAVGHLFLFGAILLFLLSLGARLGRNRILLSLALPLLVILQIILAGAGEDAKVVGALHPVNALVMLTLTGWLAWDTWRRASPDELPRGATPPGA